MAWLDDLWDAMAEQAHDGRVQATRGIVSATNDNGQAQTADVTSHAGMLHAGVEVMQIYGLASRPPAKGAIGVSIAIGGDPGDTVMLPLGYPSARFGGLAEGDTVIFTLEGTRVALRMGGKVEIMSASSVAITSPGVTITASAGVTIVGNVAIQGNLTVTGDVSDGHGKLSALRAHYDGHTHTGSFSGATSSTSQPD